MKSDKIILSPSLTEGRGWANRQVLIPVLLLMAGAAMLPLDFSAGHWAVNGGCPGFFRELLEAAEPFGNGNGILYIILAVVALDWARRRTVLRIAATAFGAGLAADLVKMTVARTRPCAFSFEGTVADTFAGFMPLTSAGSGGQSFPSAHTATAFGLAAALAWRYPRARVFFFFMATMVAAQRVTGGAHYLSDVFCGAAVAFAVATFTLHHGRLANWFGRYEANDTESDKAFIRRFPEKRAA